MNDVMPWSATMSGISSMWARDISLSLHCETAEIMRAYTQMVEEEDHLKGLEAYSAARPPHFEGLVVTIASYLAHETGLAHRSSAKAMERPRRRGRLGRLRPRLPRRDEVRRGRPRRRLPREVRVRGPRVPAVGRVQRGDEAGASAQPDRRAGRPQPRPPLRAAHQGDRRRARRRPRVAWRRRDVYRPGGGLGVDAGVHAVRGDAADRSGAAHVPARRAGAPRRRGGRGAARSFVRRPARPS